MTERPVAVPTNVANLVGPVTGVPGVAGIEPSIATTLRALDARLRRGAQDATRFGLTIDPQTGDVVVEIGLTGDRPVCQIVEQVQRTVHAALGSGPTGKRTVLVRVQSLAR